MDKAVPAIAAIGIPAAIFVTARIAAMPSGAAATTTALARLGGPLGMIGGVAFLGSSVLAIDKLGERGIDWVFSKSVKYYQNQGMSRDDLLAVINSYPISKSLKLVLVNQVEKAF